ncbi:alkaline phosphatase D family protein [Maribacter algicola]|uniref:Alkaline phosphatase D family protein n=1 Tax=Meishania litoralis TaxID=3434685 RepID=A0ACC7LP73_9FLAO
MKRIMFIAALSIFMLACQLQRNVGEVVNETKNDNFVIAFGSCNKTDIENRLWDDVLAAEPNIWIWGGDNIYADTEDMQLLRKMYVGQNQVPAYAALRGKIPIIGTWDDHDYGLNDGGVEFGAKDESQQEFLDFMGVSKESPRRFRKGVYASHDYKTKKGTIKVLVLDTRYFRTALTPDNETKKRTKPNLYGEGTVLGEEQWQWLENQLTGSKADFNIIVSSIQVLSNEHGFECWGNFPHEVDRLKQVIAYSRANGVIVLSGDRHISEFSRTTIKNLPYPLIDFTSSGLTHAYKDFSGEPNPFRVGEVVFTESFGLLHFDFESKEVQFQIVGDNGRILQQIQQSY